MIVAYRPREGCAAALDRVVARHLRVLAEEGLITERDGAVMRAVDGTVVEVFEWKSADAIAQAHGNPAVAALWAEFGAVCDYVPLTDLAETKNLFAEFEAA